MPQNLGWCDRCLTTVLKIMIISSLVFVVLVDAFAAKEVAQKYRSTISSQIILRNQKHSLDLQNCIRYSISENGKTKQAKNWNQIHNIILKLKNVIDRYDEIDTILKTLFSGVAEVGLNKSKKFRHLLLKDFNCTKFSKVIQLHKLKDRKSKRKKTYKLLLKFHSIIKFFDENFQEVITYEKSPRFRKEDRSNGNRLKELNKLRDDLNTLDVEILEILEMKKNKRLNFSRQPKKISLTILPFPKSQTDLMIREWDLIQHLKKFLKSWMKKFCCARGGKILN